MAWLTGYSYRKKITITGQAGAGTNYQIKLQIGNVSGGNFNLSGHAQSFPNDIRFTSSDGSTQLYYWIENVAVAPITVWIKVTASLETNADIYCYYGKASDITISNGTNTFDFFDDFIRADSGTIGNGWSTYIGTWSISTNRARSVANGAGQSTMYKPFSGSNNISVRGKIIMHTFHNWYMLVKAANNQQSSTGAMGIMLASSVVNIVDNGATKATTVFTYPINDTWYNYEYNIKSDYSTDAYVWLDGTTKPATPTLTASAFTPTASGTNVRFSVNSDSGGTDYFGVVSIGKYISPEPTILSTGLEEVPQGSLRITSIPSGAGIYIAPHNQTLVWTNIYTPNPVTNLSPGFYDIRLTISGYTDWTFANAEIVTNTETQIFATMSTVASITVTSITATPSETPCIAGTCTMTIVIRWSNSGGTDGSISPNITIDTIPQIAHTSRNVPAGGYIDETFIISGLPAGTHSICPKSN